MTVEFEHQNKEAHDMLSENIKTVRKSRGLSQEELAIKLNVVRQTISKWEKGLSVPDSSMLIALAEELDTTVSALLGENMQETSLNSIEEDMRSISEKLEVINLQLARSRMARIKTVRWVLAAVCVLIAAVFVGLAAMDSSYLGWNYNDPEIAAAGTILLGFEFVFVRLAPIAFAASVIGIIITYRK